MVNGAGGLGLWAIEMLKVIYGSDVVVCAVDIAQIKLDDAKQRGADVTICLDREGELRKLIKITLNKKNLFQGTI